MDYNQKETVPFNEFFMEMEIPFQHQISQVWSTSQNEILPPRKELRPFSFYINSRSQDDLIDFDQDTLEQKILEKAHSIKSNESTPQKKAFDSDIFSINEFFGTQIPWEYEMDECQNSAPKISKVISKKKESRTFRSTLNGRKNIAKYFGHQLEKYFTEASKQPLIQKNQVIQKFMREKNHNKKSFIQLGSNKVAQRISQSYFDGSLPIIQTMNSGKINDKKWTIGRIKFFKNLLTKKDQREEEQIS